MNFTFLNNLIRFIQFFSWIPSKNVKDTVAISNVILKLEPIVNRLEPKLEAADKLLEPAIKQLQASKPDIIKVWKDLQPEIQEIKELIPLIQAAMPDLIQAFNTAQPAINILGEMVKKERARGLSHDEATKKVATQFWQNTWA